MNFWISKPYPFPVVSLKLQNLGKSKIFHLFINLFNRPKKVKLSNKKNDKEATELRKLSSNSHLTHPYSPTFKTIFVGQQISNSLNHLEYNFGPSDFQQTLTIWPSGKKVIKGNTPGFPDSHGT